MGMMIVGFSLPALANIDKDNSAKIDHMFKKMDMNANGSISMEEHDSFSKKMFEEADTDNNNMISRDEMKAHKMKEKEEMKTSMGKDDRPPASRETKTNTQNN